jgi:hypothetical protein
VSLLKRRKQVTGHEQAVAMAKAYFKAVCRAEMDYWMDRSKIEPKREDYGFKHGWFQWNGHSIGAHEYAPGPTYNVD